MNIKKTITLFVLSLSIACILPGCIKKRSLFSRIFGKNSGIRKFNVDLGTTDDAVATVHIIPALVRGGETIKDKLTTT